MYREKLINGTKNSWAGTPKQGAVISGGVRL